LTNNILGAAKPAAAVPEKSEEDAETDEVPDLPRLPPTFLAHHAKGIPEQFLVTFSRQKNGAICTFVTAQPVVAQHEVKKRSHVPLVLELNLCIDLTCGAENFFSRFYAKNYIIALLRIEKHPCHKTAPVC